MNNAGPSRSSPLKGQHVERDFWGLGLSSDLPPTTSPRRTSRPDHPLYRAESPTRPTEDTPVEVLGDVSRPNLSRLTSGLERRAGSSRNGSEDGSRRGSMDKLRMEPPGEVEVLIHQVQPNESLAGIAVLYGIDLAILRKTNKMWPSDPVHLRRHLYVPLDECKWNKASEILVRGPEEGQVTLAAKTSSKGKEREVEPITLIDTGDPWSAETSRYSLNSPPLDPPTRTVDIVRIPSSQLRFFPKPPRPDSSRTSRDSDSRSRPTPDPQPPPSIQNDLIFSHHPPRNVASSGMVKLRPPTTAPSSGTGLADKFSNLFYIPPPPRLSVPPFNSARTSPRISLDSARSSQGSPSLAPIRPVEEVEMLLRVRRESEDTVKTGKERRKLD